MQPDWVTNFLGGVVLVEAWLLMHATDAPPLIKPLMERNDRLEYLLARLQPTACTCEVEGPDGIECLRCEVAAEVGHTYPEAQRKAGQDG